MKTKIKQNFYSRKFSSLRSGAGFTLIEALAAIFILSVGISAVFQAFPSGVFVQKSAQMNTIANQLCQEKMEEIVSQSYDETIGGTYGEAYGSLSLFPSYKRVTEIRYFDPNNPGVTPGSDLGVKKIKVTVFWRSHLGVAEKSISVSDLFAKR